MKMLHHQWIFIAKFDLLEIYIRIWLWTHPICSQIPYTVKKAIGKVKIRREFPFPTLEYPIRCIAMMEFSDVMSENGIMGGKNQM